MRSSRLRIALAIGAWIAGAPAWAEEGAFASFVGGGATFQTGLEPFGIRAAVLLKSSYGLSNRLNVQGPLLLDFDRGGPRLLLGSGVEYALVDTERIRWVLGGGAALRAPLTQPLGFDAGPYAHSALRWRSNWIFGCSLELHAAPLWGLSGGSFRGLLLSPVLAVLMEV